MKIYRPLLAGMALPSTILPLAYLFLPKGENDRLFIITLFIPIIWGIWNIIFHNFVRISPIIDREINIWIWGSLLGLILAIPVLDITGNYFSVWVIIMPLLCGVIWRYLIKHFNESLDLY